MTDKPPSDETRLCEELEAEHVGFILCCKVMEIIRKDAAGWTGTIRDESGAVWEVILTRLGDKK